MIKNFKKLLFYFILLLCVAITLFIIKIPKVMGKNIYCNLNKCSKFSFIHCDGYNENQEIPSPPFSPYDEFINDYELEENKIGNFIFIVISGETKEVLPHGRVQVYYHLNGEKIIIPQEVDGSYKLEKNDYYVSVFSDELYGGVYDHKIKLLHVTDENANRTSKENVYIIELNEQTINVQNEDSSIVLTSNTAHLNNLDFNLNDINVENWDSPNEFISWKVKLISQENFSLNLKYSSHNNGEFDLILRDTKGNILFVKRNVPYISTNGNINVISFINVENSNDEEWVYVELHNSTDSKINIESLFCEGIHTLNNNEINLNADNIYAHNYVGDLNHIYYEENELHSNNDLSIWKIFLPNNINSVASIECDLTSSDSGTFEVSILDEELNILESTELNCSSLDNVISSILNFNNINNGVYYIKLQRINGSSSFVNSLNLDFNPIPLEKIIITDVFSKEIEENSVEYVNFQTSYSALLVPDISQMPKESIKYNWILENTLGNDFYIDGASTLNNVNIVANPNSHYGNEAEITLIVTYDSNGDGIYESTLSSSFKVQFNVDVHTVNFTILPESANPSEITRILSVKKDMDNNYIFDIVEKTNEDWKLSSGYYLVEIKNAQNDYSNALKLLNINGKGENAVLSLYPTLDSPPLKILSENFIFNVPITLEKGIIIQNHETGKVDIIPNGYTFINKSAGGGTLSYNSSKENLSGWTDQEETIYFKTLFNKPGDYIVTADIGVMTSGGYIDLYINEENVLSSMLMETRNKWNDKSTITLGNITIGSNEIGTVDLKIGRHGAVSDIKNDFKYAFNLYGLHIMPNVYESNGMFILDDSNASYNSPYDMRLNEWIILNDKSNDNAEWLINAKEDGNYSLNIDFIKNQIGKGTFIVEILNNGTVVNSFNYNFDNVDPNYEVNTELQSDIFLPSGKYNIVLRRTNLEGQDPSVTINNLTLRKH